MKAVFVLAALGAAAAAGFFVTQGRKSSFVPSKVDVAAVQRILSDKTRPWFQGHQVPPPPVMYTASAAPEAMGAFPDPPPRIPLMPADVAWHLAMGPKNVPKGHPFEGRPAILLDMRIQSRRLISAIPSGLHVPWSAVSAALMGGPLKDLDRKTILIVYGEVYPYYETPLKIRNAGFDAVYCLEGGLNAWKEQGLPVETGTVEAYVRARDLEKALEPKELEPDPNAIGPAALKGLLDSGLQPLVIFVGDEMTYRSARIPGAIRIPLEEVKQRMEKEDRSRLIVVYCGCCAGRVAGLSGTAVTFLRQMNFTRLLHLEGHLKAWIEGGYPIEQN
ncbi:MAG TPA: rhodanese-like domain-containing protein [Planctomycetota bacterium]|nr:rhodanese-like domain-containing protein [Planctomycetota bacterium]